MGFFSNIFKKKSRNIDLKELARVRKNIKKEYSEKEVREYAYKLFKENFMHYKEIKFQHISERYHQVRKTYDVQISIDRSEISTRFFGLTDIDVLRILNNEEFVNRLKNGLEKWIGKNTIEELTYKTEFKSAFEYEYNYEIQKIKNWSNKYTYVLPLLHKDSNNYDSYVHLILYFKY